MSLVGEAGMRQLCQSRQIFRCSRSCLKGLLGQVRSRNRHRVVTGQAVQMVTAPSQEAPTQQEAAKKRVVFVVGGPGSGKGTQCDLISRDFSVPFFSAGELIRSLIASGCAEGKQLQDIILQGQIIPSAVTVGLLQKAMAETSSDTVLIDGFPRNTENRTVWQSQVGYDCEMVLLFDCPVEVMLQRLQQRRDGRVDDNEDTIRKRVQNFKSQMAPVLDYYRSIGKVTTINTDRPVEDIYSELSNIWRQRFVPTSP
ncbi:hypothetical protein VaNZ11_007156 [Volvox africanus]|uniref:adenylate kinase n=1 Tax=Volvox africanus TaxID=51714 RepID=A0ABQ5S279_9CHLO|nr:hypothetical protein VaNZ11_007156 [Volvox africanus]